MRRWATVAVVGWTWLLDWVCAAPAMPSGKMTVPVVLWHGLGDNYNSTGMSYVRDEIQKAYPGTFVYSIRLGETVKEDQNAGLFGLVRDQVETACGQLREVPELREAGSIDAIGFSQGGQFLRAYVQMCNDPPVRNLITFGSQHMGIADLPLCKPGDGLCQLTHRVARGGIYTDYVQKRIVQAQYFHDPDKEETYRSKNIFLPYLNNEVAHAHNENYRRNLKSLLNFVMVLFERDQTVVPRMSSWFGFETPGEHINLPLRDTPGYRSDALGLKSMDARGQLHFKTCQGEHMQINEECLRPIIEKWLGKIKRRGSSRSEVHAPSLLFQEDA